MVVEASQAVGGRHPLDRREQLGPMQRLGSLKRDDLEHPHRLVVEDPALARGRHQRTQHAIAALEREDLESLDSAQLAALVEDHRPIAELDAPPGKRRPVAHHVGAQAVVVGEHAVGQGLSGMHADDLHHPVLPGLSLFALDQRERAEVDGAQRARDLERGLEHLVELHGAIELLDGPVEPILLVAGSAMSPITRSTSMALRTSRPTASKSRSSSSANGWPSRRSATSTPRRKPP